MAELLTFENEAFGTFALCVAVLAIKMAFNAFLTIFMRFKYKAFENLEDVNAMGEEEAKKQKLKPRKDDQVERVRRIMLNDLENIVPFVFLGFVYILTSPTLETALWHFRIFTGARFVHFVAYFFALPQPSRALSFAVGLMVNMSMAVQIIMAYIATK